MTRPAAPLLAAALVAAPLLVAAPAAAAPSVGVPAAPASAGIAPGCPVLDARITWGFKESFRAYIDGSIANGEWTVADGATYETPEFGFPLDGGYVDPRAAVGSTGFAGTVQFTGHGGILDTTIADPVLVLRGADQPALLLLDVTGDTMDGEAVEVTEAPFVEIDLTGQDLTATDGVITIVDAPTVLTAEGEAAFPNYPAGTEFDPIDVSVDVGDCDLGDVPIGTDTDVDPADAVVPAWLPVAVGAVLLVTLAAVVAAVALMRRRS